MGRPILALDFDGVVHRYDSGWKGPWTIPDPPVNGIFAFIAEAQAYGWKVVIHSSRARYPFGIWAMRRWLKKHAGAMWYDGMGEGMEAVRFARWKPPAFLTIDDRAITFTGECPSIEFLKAFKPWNKRS